MKIYEYGSQSSSTVLLQPVDDHDLAVIDNEVKAIQELVKSSDFRLIALKVDNWNQDLSPWQAPAVFGTENFGNGAAYTLNFILSICSDIGDNHTFYIGGYSLAGLFALWSAYNTDIFSGIATASPSVWFPGFVEPYMQENTIQTSSVYLSLGDKEPKTRNPVMATVGNCISSAHDILVSRGVRTALEWNPGNHFKDPDIRTARAFAWVLENHSI